MTRIRTRGSPGPLKGHGSYGLWMCWFQGARGALTGGKKGCLVGFRRASESLLRIASLKPAVFGPPEQAFSSLRRVPASAPAIGRSFHAWLHVLPRIRPLLAAPLAAAVPFS